MSDVAMLKFAARIDVGQRDYQEDAYVCVAEGHPRYRANKGYLFVVADGVGGGGHGEVASQMARNIILDEFYKHKSAADSPKQALSEAIKAANRAIYKEASNPKSDKAGMATTVVCAVVNGNTLVVGHVGDSRAYLYEKTTRQFKQLTTDHSYMEELIAQNKLSREEALQHPQRNVITKALGPKLLAEPTINIFTLHEPVRLMLCTDGVYDPLQTTDLEYLVSAEKDLQVGCDNLVQAALGNGGGDNLTVVLVECGPPSPQPIEPMAPLLNTLINTSAVVEPVLTVNQPTEEPPSIFNSLMSEETRANGTTPEVILETSQSPNELENKDLQARIAEHQHTHTIEEQSNPVNTLQQQLLQTVEQQKAEIAQLQHALADKTSQVATIQALVAEHQSTISQRDNTIKMLQQQLENNTQLQNANTQSQQELERLQELHQSTRAEVARLTVLSRDQNQQITSEQSELAELKSLLSKAKQANEQATAEIIILKQLAQKAGDLAASEANLRQQQADQQIERERLQRWESQLAEQAQALQTQAFQKAKELEIEKRNQELGSSILLNSDGGPMPPHDSAMSYSITRRSSSQLTPKKVELVFDYEVWKANDKTAQEVSLRGLGDNLEGVFVGLKVEDAYQSGMQQKSRFSAQSYTKSYPPKVSCLSLNLMVQDRLSAAKKLIGTRYISDNTLSPTEVKEAEKIGFGIKFALGNLNSNGIKLKVAVNELKIESEAYFLKLKVEISLD